jgi:uncharacterized protein with FMN-binding domain
MKRYPVVIGATVAGLAGILSFHSRSTHSLSHALAVTAQGGASAHPSTSNSARPRQGSAPSGGASSGTAPSGTASATGANEQYGYGELAVRVSVSGTKITDLQVVGLQTADSYSQQIADQVIPYLRQEVISAQSARINGISGATYTSEAYAMSVQSALDRLHV